MCKYWTNNSLVTRTPYPGRRRRCKAWATSTEPCTKPPACGGSPLSRMACPGWWRDRMGPHPWTHPISRPPARRPPPASGKGCPSVPLRSGFLEHVVPRCLVERKGRYRRVDSKWLWSGRGLSQNSARRGSFRPYRLRTTSFSATSNRHGNTCIQIGPVVRRPVLPEQEVTSSIAAFPTGMQPYGHVAAVKQDRSSGP